MNAMKKSTKKLLLLMSLCITASASADHHNEGRTRTGDVGDALEIVMPLLSLGGTLVNKDWEGARQFSYGLISTLVVTHGIKDAVSKERPDGRDDESLPSSHTAVSVHAAAYLQRRYGWRIGAPAYVLATYVGYSRVYDDRHDEQDVLLGAAIGYAAARLFTRKHPDLRIAPIVGRDVVGVTLDLKF
ncbi:MAG: membrane-associated phospholipid phosphatase [Candidatus Azotimanducaceae bacterium]